MPSTTKKILIILLRLDTWTYIVTGVAILITILFSEHRVFVTLVLLAQLLVRKFLTDYLRGKSAEESNREATS